jgi:hypothetical protein
MFVNGSKTAEARIQLELDIERKALCCPDVVAVQD